MITILIRSFQQLPCPRLEPLNGFFEPEGRPLRALNSPCTLVPDMQRNNDTVRNNCGNPWLCVCWKHTCFCCSINWEGPSPPVWPPLTAVVVTEECIEHVDFYGKWNATTRFATQQQQECRLSFWDQGHVSLVATIKLSLFQITNEIFSICSFVCLFFC